LYRNRGSWAVEVVSAWGEHSRRRFAGNEKPASDGAGGAKGVVADVERVGLQVATAEEIEDFDTQ
jgi:hypothetical protein